MISVKNNEFISWSLSTNNFHMLSNLDMHISVWRLYFSYVAELYFHHKKSFSLGKQLRLVGSWKCPPPFIGTALYKLQSWRQNVKKLCVWHPYIFPHAAGRDNWWLWWILPLRSRTCWTGFVQAFPCLWVRRFGFRLSLKFNGLISSGNA